MYPRGGGHRGREGIVQDTDSAGEDPRQGYGPGARLSTLVRCGIPPDVGHPLTQGLPLELLCQGMASSGSLGLSLLGEFNGPAVLC